MSSRNGWDDAKRRQEEVKGLPRRVKTKTKKEGDPRFELGTHPKKTEAEKERKKIRRTLYKCKM